jgi:hypothetical protein
MTKRELSVSEYEEYESKADKGTQAFSEGLHGVGVFVHSESQTLLRSCLGDLLVRDLVQPEELWQAVNQE